LYIRIVGVPSRTLLSSTVFVKEFSMRGHVARFVLLMIFVLFAVSPLRAQRSLKPLITERVRPETARDAKLEAAIKAPEGGGTNPSDAGSDDTFWSRYYYNRVDLNGDGRPEVIVYLFGTYTCGTGGCDTLIFRQTGEGYELVADISLTRNPIIVSEHKTNGWNDLIIMVAGGGIQPGYYAVLPFDGKTYPDNTTAKTALPLKTTARGKAYLVGDGSKESGFAL
jgi:hypothetical protein